MAAGLGFKTFTTGEVLTAADTNGYLMQGVLVFASSAARSAAVTSPQEGQYSYLKDTDVLEFYNGTAWTSAPVGDITSVGVTSPITGGGLSGAVTIAIQDATTSVKGSVQLSDSVSTTSSILAATPTAVKSAYDLATTANTNTNNITMVQQYTATESVLKNISSRIPAGEQLLKQAVYWIDAAQSDNSDQILDNQGWGAPSLTTQLGSTTSADSNDPKFLDFAGTNYVYTTGVNSNYLSIPDSNALDITGDIDLRAYLAMDDWTPSAVSGLVTKWQTSQRSYNLSLNTSGTLVFSWSTDGTTTLTATSTVATGVTDGDPKWVRATLDVDNGAVGNDVKFWLSNDGITWTQLGATVTTALTTSIYAGTFQVNVSGDFGGSNTLAGKIYRAQILNGIDGTKVLDVDTSVIGSGSATTFDALTGQTVTINRSGTGKKTSVVTAPLWLFGTDDLMTVADNDLVDFDATQDFTLFAVTRTFTNAGTGNRAILVKQISAATQAGYALINNSRQTNIQIRDSSTLVGDASGTQIADGSLMVSTGVVSRSTTTETAYEGIITNGGTSISTVTGSLANASALTIGRYANDTYSDMEFVAAAIFRRALTASEISTLTNYYTARVGA